MNTNENSLTKQELQHLLAELELGETDSTDGSGVASGHPVLEQCSSGSSCAISKAGA